MCGWGGLALALKVDQGLLKAMRLPRSMFYQLTGEAGLVQTGHNVFEYDSDRNPA